MWVGTFFLSHGLPVLLDGDQLHSGYMSLLMYIVHFFFLFFLDCEVGFVLSVSA